MLHWNVGDQQQRACTGARAWARIRFLPSLLLALEKTNRVMAGMHKDPNILLLSNQNGYATAQINVKLHQLTHEDFVLPLHKLEQPRTPTRKQRYRYGRERAWIHNARNVPWFCLVQPQEYHWRERSALSPIWTFLSTVFAQRINGSEINDSLSLNNVISSNIGWLCYCVHLSQST